MTVTVWTNNDVVILAQLSDNPADGTALEQIAHMGSLSAYAGYTCVSVDYTGSVPDADPASWRWNGTAIVAVTPVPVSITPRQCRLILSQQGLLAGIEQTIAGMDEATRITWEYALEFRRDDPLLNALGANLGLTDTQIDQFFIAAAQL